MYYKTLSQFCDRLNVRTKAQKRSKVDKTCEYMLTLNKARARLSHPPIFKKADRDSLACTAESAKKTDPTGEGKFEISDPS
jgi:hypothetical protein